jgi:hypothetical protein
MCGISDNKWSHLHQSAPPLHSPPFHTSITPRPRLVWSSSQALMMACASSRRHPPPSHALHPPAPHAPTHSLIHVPPPPPLFLPCRRVGSSDQAMMMACTSSRSWWSQWGCSTLHRVSPVQQFKHALELSLVLFVTSNKCTSYLPDPPPRIHHHAPPSHPPTCPHRVRPVQQNSIRPPYLLGLACLIVRAHAYVCSVHTRSLIVFGTVCDVQLKKNLHKVSTHPTKHHPPRTSPHPLLLLLLLLL